MLPVLNYNTRFNLGIRCGLVNSIIVNTGTRFYWTIRNFPNGLGLEFNEIPNHAYYA